MIRLFQMLHYQLSDFPAGHFRFPFQAQLPFDFMGHILNGFHRYGTFLKRFQQTVKQFRAVKEFPSSVLFVDHQRRFFILLVCSKTPVALGAFPAATNRCAIFNGTGINDATVFKRAKRASHKYTFLSSTENNRTTSVTDITKRQFLTAASFYEINQRLCIQGGISFPGSLGNPVIILPWDGSSFAGVSATACCLGGFALTSVAPPR